MPTVVVKDKEKIVYGSIVCEDPINGELNLNFFTSTVKREQNLASIDDKSIIYPQRPMQ